MGEEEWQYHVSGIRPSLNTLFAEVVACDMMLLPSVTREQRLKQSCQTYKLQQHCIPQQGVMAQGPRLHMAQARCVES